MFQKIAMNHVNTNLHGCQSSAAGSSSRQQITEQSAALHNFISYTDENCDSAGVSQRLLNIISTLEPRAIPQPESSCQPTTESLTLYIF